MWVGEATEAPWAVGADERGCFSVCVPAHDNWTLYLTGPGHAIASWIAGDKGDEESPCGVRLQLARAGRLVGRVVDVAGMPVTTGHVRVLDDEQRRFRGDPAKDGDCFAASIWQRGVRSSLDYGAWSPIGSDGTFDIEHVLAGAPMFVIVHSAEALPEYLPVTVEPDETKEIEIVVKKPARVRGRIALPDRTEGEVLALAYGTLFHPAHRNARRQCPPSFGIENDGSFDVGPLLPADVCDLTFTVRITIGESGRGRMLHCSETISLAPEEDLVLDIARPHWKQW